MDIWIAHTLSVQFNPSLVSRIQQVSKNILGMSMGTCKYLEVNQSRVQERLTALNSLPWRWCLAAALFYYSAADICMTWQMHHLGSRWASRSVQNTVKSCHAYDLQHNPDCSNYMNISIRCPIPYYTIGSRTKYVTKFHIQLFHSLLLL